MEDIKESHYWHIPLERQGFFIMTKESFEYKMNGHEKLSEPSMIKRKEEFLSFIRKCNAMYKVTKNYVIIEKL